MECYEVKCEIVKMGTKKCSNFRPLCRKLDWSSAPESVIIEIFSFLSPRDVLNAGECCHHWNRISYDQILWKRKLFRLLKLDSSTSISPGKTSWYYEYKRLAYKTPLVCSEVERAHRNEVLHVSFSHDGTMFATSSKDSFIIVWSSAYPVSIKHRYDMKKFRWKCTQFSQFNKSDTLLLVSGVHFGSTTSTSGEIAVFSLQDGFNLQCRVGNKPYDIFGTWYSDSYLISGDLIWLSRLVSKTGLWLNKASQETESEHTPILNNLFRFSNINASSVRAVMVADCPEGCKLKTSKDEQTAKTLGVPEELDIEEDEELIEECEKLLIFTTGSKTYTPHQIGFKKISRIKFPKVLNRGPSVKERQERLAKRNETRSPPAQNGGDLDGADKFDHVDFTLDLHGHIVGMSLSPDHRYLYVNSRPWPKGYTISNPLEPPPIAQEIDIHVIDLTELCEVGKMLGSHKAYTPNNECFFIFLDVCDEYVASGAEDRHGYLWDRHYRACLAKLPHADVVNSVAFNPANSEMLVSTSDDFEIKVWRSKSFLDETCGQAKRLKMPHAVLLKKF